MESSDTLGTENYTGKFTGEETEGIEIALKTESIGRYYLHIVSVDNAGNRTEAKWPVLKYLWNYGYGDPRNVDKYGWRVPDYDVELGNVGCWRLFYQDDDFTYIISDKSFGSYVPQNHLSDYSDASSVSEAGRYLNPMLNDGGSDFFSADNNDTQCRALAYLTDTSDGGPWSKYKNEDALFAIASPTIELQVASGNAKALISGGDLVSLYFLSGLIEYRLSSYTIPIRSGSNGIYMANKVGSDYWLASPITSPINTLKCITYSNSNLVSTDISSKACIRPVVCFETPVFNAKYLETLMDE